MVTGFDAKSCNNNKAQTKPEKVICAEGASLGWPVDWVAENRKPVRES